MKNELHNNTPESEVLPSKIEQDGELSAVESDTEKPKKKSRLLSKFKSGSRKKKIITIILLIIVVIIAVSVLRSCGSAGAKVSDTTYTEEAVTARTITQSLSGSGTLEPANSYTINTLTQGEILSANFEEGDVVTKDTVLYQIDSSDVASNLEKAQLSLNSAQRSYEDAQQVKYVKSPIAGQVYSLDVSVGDEVTAGQQIGTIRSSSTMTVKIPFPADDTKSFYIGQSATVTLDGSFETLTGKVTAISGSDTVLTGNMIVRYVTIQVTNPGALTNSQSATATIAGVGCSSAATFDYKAEGTLTASAAGTVTSINAKEGTNVSKDQVVVTLGGDNIDDQIQSSYEQYRNAQLSYDSAQDGLDNYTITAPIDGTIVDKAYKAGESVESGKTLCTIYDLSYLQMTMSIDELDIINVAVGQTVKITADAVDGEYEGVITKVSVAGTTTNGTTTYPVTVQLSEVGDLLPGMNVDAEIVVAEANNALSVSSAAIERGNKVLITADSPSAANALEDEAPEGYVYVSVETGISDDDYIEITSGLQDGDTIAYIKAVVDTSSSDMMMYAMEGDGGGAPADGGNGGGGGAPSGGGPMG